MNSMERQPNAYQRHQYNTSRSIHPPHIVAACAGDPGASLSQQNLMQSAGSMNANNGHQTPDLPYSYDSMPSNYRSVFKLKTDRQ